MPGAATMSARILSPTTTPAVVESVSWVLEEHGYAVSAVAGAAALLALLAQGEERAARPAAARHPDARRRRRAAARADQARRAVARRAGAHALVAPAEEYTVRTLGLGAADFVRKPFRPRELVARIQAQLRAGAVLRTTREALRRTEEELERARDDAENRRKLVDILHEVTGDLAATRSTTCSRAAWRAR
jgi:two-component system cell cycle response regulator